MCQNLLASNPNLKESNYNVSMAKRFMTYKV